MFTTFSAAVEKHFTKMSEGELFVVQIDDIFDKYLATFPAGSNPIYKTRTEHDCQCCKHFVRNIGKVVSIKNGKIITIWDNLKLPSPYNEVAKQMGDIVRNSPIVSVYRTQESKYGINHNYDKDQNRHDHFYVTIGVKHHTREPDTKRGELNSIFQVFKRGLNEIKLNDIDTVLDLINQNQLYRGAEFKDSIVGFKKLLQEYQKSKSDLFVWENLQNRNARFRNTVIGTLLTDLYDGFDLETSVKSFEQKVAPLNYKRTTSIITQRMVEDAVQTLNNLGLGGAIYRRYARLSDVSVNDVLFVDNNSKNKMKDGVAALLETSVKKSVPDTKKAQALAVDDFIKDVLPTAKSISVLVENRHTGNFVSLTGSDGQEKLFKWNNNFAWSYDGEVTDSVKQRVKAAGGNINATLRVSLSWFNLDDLDLHAYTPSNRNHIYYGNKSGILDVDMNAGMGRTRTPVENLAFMRLEDGTYRIYVHQFSQREHTDFGFAIEVEYDGKLNQYSYSKVVKGHIDCLQLKVKNGQLTNIVTDLEGGSFSQDKWGVKTESLVPVTSIMYSPNHWSGQTIGAKHVIFALENCKNPEATRGIYNEFLRSDLEKHRKVFEVLGSKTKCKYSDDQISGVGFTAARGDTVTVVVDGRRSYNLMF
jgi:hypothetical protein